MGEVNRARETRLDRSVAIKLLPEHLAGADDFRARFDHEARAAAGAMARRRCRRSWPAWGSRRRRWSRR